MVTSTAAPLTTEEFSRLPRNGENHELSEGKLITMPPAKSFHSRIVAAVLRALQMYIQNETGAEAIPEAGHVLSHSPLTVRQPDIAVIRNDQIHATPQDSYFEGAPAIAIEVVSPSETAEELEIKAQQYLRSGGEEVWIIFPKTRTSHVYGGSGNIRVLEESETLESTTLAGFSVPVARLFPQ